MVQKEGSKINVFVKASTKVFVSNEGKLIVQSEMLPTVKPPSGFYKSKFMFLLLRTYKKSWVIRYRVIREKKTLNVYRTLPVRAT